MQSIIRNLFLFLLLFGVTSASTPSFNINAGRHGIACKGLKNDVLLYFVFLDTRTTSPWSEFSVVSYKYPSEIAHSFLHLYCAADLYKSHFRRSARKIKMANQAFPDEIMSDVYARSLKDLEIGDFTRYMIGWTEELDSEYEPLLAERHSLFK